MTTEERKALIARYKEGYRVVAEALAHATEEELDARPGPGKWSARELVHHLADAEMTAATRLRLLLALETRRLSVTTRISSRGSSTTTDRSPRPSTRSRPPGNPRQRSSSA